MANHVSTYVHFYRVSEAGEARLEELYQRIKGIDDDGVYEYMATDLFGEPDEVVEDYQWRIDHVGAKWCYIEDPDPNGFRLTSAWSVPWDLIGFVAEEIRKVDPDVFITVDYEDEMPNFVGWATWHSGSFDEGREWEWEEMLEWMRNNDEELAACWDEEAEDWKEGMEDDAHDMLWDAQADFQEDVVNHTLMEEVHWYMDNEEDIKAELAEAENGTV